MSHSVCTSHWFMVSLVSVLTLVASAGCSGGSVMSLDDTGGLDGSLADAAHATDGGARDAADAFSGLDAGAVDDAGQDAAASGDAGTDAAAVLDDAGTDAAAPACTSGTTCLDAPPSGWTGPVLFYEGAAAAPACPALTSLAFDGGAGLVAPPAVCSACTCGSAAGVACGDPTASIYDTSTCGGTPCASATLTASCSQIRTALQCASSVGTQLYVALSSTALGGSCSASTQVPTVTAPTWGTSARLCMPSGAEPSCGATSVCAPSASSSFSACIFQLGDVPCPSGAYTTRSLVDTGVSDTRSCSACGCGTASGSCSGGQVAISPNVTCGAGVPNTVPIACQFDGIPATLPYYGVVTTPPSGTGSCSANGGVPSGSAVGTTPITVCCL